MTAAYLHVHLSKYSHRIRSLQAWTIVLLVLRVSKVDAVISACLPASTSWAAPCLLKSMKQQELQHHGTYEDVDAQLCPLFYCSSTDCYSPLDHATRSDDHDKNECKTSKAEKQRVRPAHQWKLRPTANLLWSRRDRQVSAWPTFDTRVPSCQSER